MPKPHELLIDRSFKNFSHNSENERIPLERLPALVENISRSLKEDQLIYLAKLCCSEDNKYIDKGKFKKAVVLLAKDVSLEPYETS